MQDSAASTVRDAPETGTAAKHRGWLRRLYFWVLHWAHTPYGTPALFGISFAESSFFPLPPDILQIALSVSRPRRSFHYAAVSAAASVLGGIAGWFVGYALWESASGLFFHVPGVTAERVRYVGECYQDNAFLTIFGAAFSPIPYKVFTLSAGVFHDYVPLQTLIVASILGRSLRFFSVATCIYFCGPRVRDVLEKYFEAVTLTLFVMLVLGILALRWF